MFRGKIDPTTGSIVFSNDDEEEKDTGGAEGIRFGTDSSGRLTGGFTPSASTVQEWAQQTKQEEATKIDERLRYFKEVTPEIFQKKKEDGTTVSEEDLRTELSSGKYDTSITSAEREKWDKSIRAKADKEVRSSPYLIDQLGVGLRDLGETANAWIIQPAAEILRNPFGAFQEGTKQIGVAAASLQESLADSAIDYNDLPEIQSAREQGIIQKPKSINVSDEEYQNAYYAYEADVKEQTNRLSQIDKRISAIQANEFSVDAKNSRNELGELVTEQGKLKRYLYTMDVYLGQKTVNRDLIGTNSLVGQKGLEELTPFIGSIDKMNDTLKAKDIFDKYENGETLTNVEKSVIKEYMAYALDSRINYGIGSSVGSMLADIPSFAVEYAFTGGLAQLGKKGAEKLAVKIGSDSVVRKVASNILQSGITKAIAGAGVRTATGFSPRVAASTAEYMLPSYDYVVTPEGKAEAKKLDDGDDFGKALIKAYGSVFVESITEELGAFIEKPQAFLKSALFGKATSSIAKKTGEALAPNLVSKTLKSIGWNGLMGEVLEEEVSGFFQAPIEGRQYQDPLTTKEGRERFLVEFIGLGMFAGIGKVSSATLTAKNRIAAKYEAEGVATTIPLEGNVKSMEWRNEAKLAFKENSTETNVGQLDGDIKVMQDMLDNYQDGHTINAAAIPASIKSMLLQGALPTLSTRIGAATMKKVNSDMGMLPLNEDGSVNEDAARANQPYTDTEEQSAARVPAEQLVDGKAVSAGNGVVEQSTKASNAALEKITQSQDTPDVKARELESLISEIDNNKYTDDVAQTTAKFAKMELENIQKKLNGAPPTEQEAKGVTKPPTAQEAVAKGATDVQELTQTLRGTKGMTADQIQEQLPNIKLTKEVAAKDVYGNSVVIPNGEKLTPYEMKDGKIVLQDGQAYVVSKNQFANIKGNTVGGEAKPFAPELDGTEETVKGSYNEKTSKLYSELEKKNNGQQFDDWKVADQDEWMSKRGKPQDTKYSSYQLPDGTNYKEVLIKAPESFKQGEYGTEVIDMSKRFKSSHWDEPNVISHLRINERVYEGKKVTFMEELQSDWAREGRSKGFIEDQKDISKEIKRYNELARKRDSATPEQLKSISEEQRKLEEIIDKNGGNIGGVPNNPLLKNWQETSVKRALKDAVDNNSEYFAWINGEQTSARYNLATKVDNVEWKPVKREYGDSSYKDLSLIPKDSKTPIKIRVEDDGTISYSSQGDWTNKKLDEVLGKGLADKIMADESGTLSGDGLKFGGEWANTLYDKQVGNIVKDLTGARVEMMDMGLPIDKEKVKFYLPSDETLTEFHKGQIKSNDIKVGKEIMNGYRTSFIITDVLGDGKFKAVPKNVSTSAIGFEAENAKGVSGMVDFNDFSKTQQKTIIKELAESFDISVKTTLQQGIRLTPEIKAKIRGEALEIKTSGKKFEDKPPQVKQDAKSQATLPEVTKEISPPARRFGERADVISTVQNRKAASMMPVKVEGTEFKSRLLERVRERLGNQAGDSVSYERVNMAEDASRAVEFQQTYPERAVKVGLGLELAPEGILTNDVAWAAYEAAKEGGQLELSKRLLQSLTNRSTRYGQEIASLRGKFGDVTPEYFIKEVINARMASADNAKIFYQVGNKSQKAVSATERVQERIQNASQIAQKMISAESLKFDSAQNIIDSLTCN